VSSGSQSYGTDPSEYPVSQPIPKIDGILQTSGKVPTLVCHKSDFFPLVKKKKKKHCSV
jgi:hypothetical protein